ncbi:MAG: TM0996/MTH895 family glutaredoxin-like protein [Pirellulaceae bacterium]|nr:TM0996/MTH895 family glutaredoxin-like protein [Pirellulaceae bacterium]
MKNVLILGTGCRKCAHLQAQAEQAVKNLGIQAEIQKVEDITKITEYGVFMTPALVVDGQVKTQGRIPTVAEIEKFVG